MIPNERLALGRSGFFVRGDNAEEPLAMSPTGRAPVLVIPSDTEWERRVDELCAQLYAQLPSGDHMSELHDNATNSPADGQVDIGGDASTTHTSNDSAASTKGPALPTTAPDVALTATTTGKLTVPTSASASASRPQPAPAAAVASILNDLLAPVPEVSSSRAKDGGCEGLFGPSPGSLFGTAMPARGSKKSASVSSLFDDDD